MQNWDKYLMIALIGVVLFILLKMNKVMSLQTTLMIGMAGKMGVKFDEEVPEAKKVAVTPPPAQEQESEGEEENTDEEIVRIAEKLYKGKSLTKKDKDFYDKFKKEIDEESEFFLTDDLKGISEKITNRQELNEGEAELYKENYEDFKDELKLAELTENIPVVPIPEKDLVRPENETERIQLLLSFFSDGMPKVIGALAKMYADKTGLAVSTGNTAKLLDKMLEAKTLMNQKILHESRNKVFYGLPDWFDGKKFQKEYLKKLK